MALQEVVAQLRKKALAQRRQPVPDTYQGVSKERIAEVLREIDRYTVDQCDAVFALLDDVSPSFYSLQSKNFSSAIKFCEGATVAHVGCHFGILQRGEGKSDREGRDYWLKPLWAIGAIEKVFFDKARRQFIPGHPVAKSPYTAYRLADSFKAILTAPDDKWRGLLKVWGWEGEAFGNTQPNQDPDGNGVNTVINLRFPGQYYDAESGLFYGGDRYWDPRLGRSITADRMSVATHVERWRTGAVPGRPPLEINPYAHVLNNPLRWIDRTGMEATIPAPSLPAPGTGIGSGIGRAIGGAARICLRALSAPVAIVIEGMMPGVTGDCGDDRKCSDTKDDDDPCWKQYEEETQACWANYGMWGNSWVVQACLNRAKERWIACKRGVPDHRLGLMLM